MSTVADVFTDETLTTDCSQCGQPIPETTMSKRKARGSDESRCADCLARPSESIRYGNFICRPWHGDFDWDTMVPLKDGKPYKPGHRLCGHADCVTGSHIVQSTSAGELVSLTVRAVYVNTGKLITLEQAEEIVRKSQNVA